MDIQEIIAYSIVAGAAIYLVKRFFFRRRKNKSGNCGDDCGCH